MITYEVNQADLQRVMKKLKGMETKAPRVIKNAINKTAKEARKTLAEGAQDSYTVKNAGFNSRMKIEKATAGKLYAVIRAQERTLTVTRYHATAPKSGAKAEIVKSGLKTIVGSMGIKAFKISGGQGAGLIAQRKTKARKPIKVLRSNSVPKMLEKVYEGERGMKGALEPVISKSLHDAINAEIAKLI